ncbi:MAG: hypothetical protein INR65_18845, partial [Gluconacetobacter diazotrophicus]|nr:hypothetical protein [Gluconacetobacter diazotrophicus]
MKRVLWLGSATIALAAGAAHAQSFRNPVFGSEDPAITRVNNTYYYSESCGVGSAASAAHGICLRTSKTLEG